jgi:hypothetical protein
MTVLSWCVLLEISDLGDPHPARKSAIADARIGVLIAKNGGQKAAYASPF